MPEPASPTDTPDRTPTAATPPGSVLDFCDIETGVRDRVPLILMVSGNFRGFRLVAKLVDDDEVELRLRLEDQLWGDGDLHGTYPSMADAIAAIESFATCGHLPDPAPAGPVP